jgi:hypothetical protein
MNISKDMRARLRMNAQGKLASQQYLDLVVEPLTPLLILLVPGIILAGTLFGRLLIAGRGLLFALLIGLVVFGLPVVMRIWRYSNPEVLSAVLYTGTEGISRWMVWRPETLYTTKGDPVKFRRRVAPVSVLNPNTAYLVFYLEEPNSLVLLSLLPADHPDAGMFKPIGLSA